MIKHSTFGRCLPHSITVFFPLFLTLGQPAFSQDSEFIACARFEDRAQRIACLEDALEAARPEAETATAPDTDSTETAPVTPAPPAATEESIAGDDTDKRIDDFGRARVEENAQGKEELFDTVESLERRRNLWRITLSSGQIWAQTYPRFYNLRERDNVRIYQDQEGFGDGYRLATERLNGFIRVKRLE